MKLRNTTLSYDLVGKHGSGELAAFQRGGPDDFTIAADIAWYTWYAGAFILEECKNEIFFVINMIKIKNESHDNCL